MFPTIKEPVLRYHSAAIKSNQGAAIMGYLFVTDNFLCFATKKNKVC